MRTGVLPSALPGARGADPLRPAGWAAVPAQQDRTVHLTVGSRLTLGVGLSPLPIRPARKSLTLLRALLMERRARFQGRDSRVDLALRFPKALPPGLPLAALGPRRLRVAGELADGTVVWLGGPRSLGDPAVPLLRRSAREVGRPEPRVVASLPVAVTSAVEAARAAPRRFFGFYGQLPSYRAVLDREGAAGPEKAGATDSAASPFPVGEDPEARVRTVDFLADPARTGPG